MKRRKVLRHHRPHLHRQAFREDRVVLIDEPVLVPEREGIRSPHAYLAVGADDLPAGGQHVLDAAGRAAVEMLNGGDAARDHLEGGEERVEPQVHVAERQTRGEPELQRMVRRAELERRQAHMVVRVDQAGDDHLAPAADEARIRMPPPHIRGRSDGGDHAVDDQKRRVVVDDRRAFRVEALDDAIALDQRDRACGHRLNPCGRSGRRAQRANPCCP